MSKGFEKSGESLEQLLKELSKDKGLMDDYEFVVAPTDMWAGTEVEGSLRGRCKAS